ncbi:PREDICTED: putative SERF-like protein [Nicrophorus vespilloides]|uniref:SERF-like protein n=1 Tax=Nicrophorus vespilloides TaxID=110193 RepID=A0ABM1NCK7_NICVS|nr:PREDICTED: putative SERF-like protein [Nicrophorus vespilloides]
MTRGNQRDLARAKNMKKQQELNKSKQSTDGLTLTQRKERDAQVMRDKQIKKEMEKEKSKNKS